MVDLHVHSNRSDGTYSPKELVDYAMEKGLTAFALTDHDTVDGLQEAMDYAASLGQAQAAGNNPAVTSTDETSPNKGIPEVVPGIEFSTEYLGRDVHILGLYIDYQNPRFLDYLKEFVASRDLRNEKMCRSLQGIGMDITYTALRETFPGAVITRAHYAQYMLQKGYIKSLKEAFERYIGDYCPHYIPREKIAPEQAIGLTLEAGGIPVLAHPMLYHLGSAQLSKLVAQLKEAGLQGIEAIYATYSPAEERQVRKLAAEYDLLITGGSDFHGDNKPGQDLGVGFGKLYVHDEVLTNLKKVLIR